jgi:hypothetical protein
MVLSLWRSTLQRQCSCKNWLLNKETPDRLRCLFYIKLPVAAGDLPKGEKRKGEVHYVSNKALFFFMLVYFLFWRNFIDIMKEFIAFTSNYPFFPLLLALVIYVLYRLRKNKSDGPGV